MRLRRYLAPITLLVLALTAVSGCVSDPRDSEVPTDYVIQQADRSDMPDEIKDIYDSGKLTIGTKFDQPLTGYRDDATGRIEGFDIEIGRILTQRIFGNVAEGDNLFFVESVSSNREKYLMDGTVDMVAATYTMTDKRKDKVDFAGPYYVAGQSIMSRKDSDVDSAKDLDDKKVCVAKGSVSADHIRKENPKAKISEMRDYSSCQQALLDKKYDAISTDNTILYGYANENPDDLSVSDDLFTEEPYGVGLPHGSPDLKKFINDTLQTAFENGDWETAFSHTLEVGGVPTPKQPPTLDRY